VSSIFDKHYKKYDAWYVRNKFAYISELEAIRKVLPKKGRGLEIGAGTGRFAGPLGIKLGIDPSRPMLKIAKQRGVDARFGSGEKLPFRNSSFDHIVIIITLSFTKDPIAVLKEARRVLKKDAKIIIGIVDKASFLGKAYERKKSLFYKEANLLSAKDVTALLRALNFKRILCYQTVFKLPSKMNSIEKLQRGFGKGGFVIITAKKSSKVNLEINRKFIQHEKVRLLFRKYGYDMEEERQKVFRRAGELKEPILDVGTGSGRMAYVLALAGHTVTTIDISKEVQKIAMLYTKKYTCLDKIKFMKMDAQDMSFKDESFSTVISANLLHDVKNPKQVVDEIIRIAKPGGKIIISDLNRRGRALVDKVYRVDREIHKGKLMDLDKIAGNPLKNATISFKKYNDGYITTYVGKKDFLSKK